MRYRNLTLLILFILLLTAALIFAASQARRDEAAATSRPWIPPQLTPEPSQPTPTSGWWGELPTAIPFPTPTPRN